VYSWPANIKTFTGTDQRQTGYSHRPGADSSTTFENYWWDIPQFINNGRKIIPGPPGWVGQNRRIPKMREVNNKAIMSDLEMATDALMLAHGDGFNVLMGNGAVKWVPTSAAVRERLYPFPSSIAGGSNNPSNWTPSLQFDPKPATVTPHTARMSLWEIFDRH
jgi:hypothetical protein